jgi:hypothetical protein
LDDRSIGSRDRSIWSGVPRAAWLLLGIAAIQLAVAVAMDWYQLFGPYLILRPEMIIGALTSVAPFLLAAAVLTGAVRWPAGRRWLGWGAAAFGLYGVTETILSIWLLSWSSSPSPGPVAGWTQAGLIARASVSLLAALVAPMFLAMGLRAARNFPVLDDRARRIAMVAIGVLGFVAVAGGIALAAAEAAGLNEAGAAWLTAVFRGSTTLAAATMALLGVAAVGAAPRQRALPELLIAVGVSVVIGASAWTWWFQALVPYQEQGAMLALVFTGPRAANLIGLLLLIAGFAAGALLRDRGEG